MNSRELNPECFRRFAVWAWSDDEDYHCPVAQAEPLPEGLGALFVAAKHRTADGVALDGYVVADMGRVFAVGVFVGDRDLVFNRNLPEMADLELGELRGALGDSQHTVFPITYQTRSHFANGTPLRGVFDIRKE